MSWPSLPDGTVDWASVFEAPDTGLIPLIDKADTEDKLQACCHVVIQSLFQRDSDAAVRFTYTSSLSRLFTDDHSAAHLITLKGRIRLLLREMKNERMARSLAFLRMKQGTATAEDERRLAEDDPLAALEILNDPQAV